jgi:hypothetical protein
LVRLRGDGEREIGFGAREFAFGKLLIAALEVRSRRGCAQVLRRRRGGGEPAAGQQQKQTETQKQRVMVGCHNMFSLPGAWRSAEGARIENCGGHPNGACHWPPSLLNARDGGKTHHAGGKKFHLRASSIAQMTVY